MPIRFKCTSCQKALVVKDHLAGKRVACPACKKPVVVPAAQPAAVPAAPQAPPVDVEAIAAAALAEDDNKKKAEEQKAAPKATGTIDFVCDYCDAQLKLPVDLAGKKTPCPECKRIVRVPNPKEDKPKDWRTVQEGPSVALAAQKPPAPEGAWDGTVKKVSLEALSEADAFPEEEAEPVGVLGWGRRAVIAAAVVGAVYLGYFLINRQQREVVQQVSLEQLMEMVESKGKEKLTDDMTAEIFRGAGELQARKSKAGKARTFFRKALAQFPPDPNKISPDDDLCLIELALSMLELGGNERDAIAGERIEWKDLDKDLSTVLGRIRSDEARVIGLRAVATRLFQRGQGPLALGLANKLSPLDGGKSPIQAQWVAIALQQAKPEVVAKQVPAPDLNADNVDVIARCGYAEGKARKGDIEAALQLATAAGAPEDRLLAAVGTADLLQDEARDAKQATRFIGPAAAVINEMKEATVPAWSRYLLVKAYARAHQLDSARNWVKQRIGDDKRAAELKSWGELEIVRARLSKLNGAAETTVPEEVADKKSLAHAFAWEAWARHNTQQGFQSDVRDMLDKMQDPRIKAMLLLGMALGN